MFCPGIPGAGKTFLAAAVIEHLQEIYRHSPEVGIAFGYCTFLSGHQDDQKAEDFIACLLRQLAGQLDAIPEAITQLYERKSRKLQDLIEALCSVAELYYRRIFIIIDALDEWEVYERGCSEFLSALMKFQSKSKSNLLATSRPGIANITGIFQGHPTLEILAHQEDLRVYLAGHVGRVGNLSTVIDDVPCLHEEIVNSIATAADGM